MTAVQARPIPDQELTARWLALFPALSELEPEHHADGSKDEYYDIDFWVNHKTGKLEVDNVKVHKVPVQEDGVWTQVPRYTFEGMDFDETN
jgi:hypothetical protein